MEIRRNASAVDSNIRTSRTNETEKPGKRRSMVFSFLERIAGAAQRSHLPAWEDLMVRFCNADNHGVRDRE